MQYAHMEIANRRIIISAREYEVLHNYDSNATPFPVVIPEEEDVQYKMVYGSFIPQPTMDFTKASDNVTKSKGLALGTILENDECRVIELSDVILYTKPINKMNHVGFAALLRTDLDIPKLTEIPLTAFLRYQDMIVEDNLLNRYGVFCIKDQERRKKKDINLDNWHELIDYDRLLKVAGTLK